jgi:hypothetical protein
MAYDAVMLTAASNATARAVQLGSLSLSMVHDHLPVRGFCCMVWLRPRALRPRPSRWCMKWPPRDLFPFKRELPLLSIQPH